jgi:hypothetical protein
MKNDEKDYTQNSTPNRCYEGKTLYGQGKPQQTGMTAEIYSIPTYAI